MTATHSLIPLTSRAEWQDALLGVSHSFGQTWESCFALYLTTGLPTYLYLLETEGVRVVCPVAEREWAGYTDIMKPFGFSGFVGTGPCPQFARYWREFVEQRGYVCGYLGVHPVFDWSDNLDQQEVFEYDTVHVLDLRPDPGELWDRMSSNRRRQLRDWHDIRDRLVLDRQRVSEFFLDHYMEFFERKGAEDFYFLSKETVTVILDLDNTFVVGAGHSGNIEAVAVFSHTRYGADYLFHVSLPEGTDLTPYLIWYAVTYFKSLGIPLLNLGGGGGGIGESKRRYGGTQHPLKCVKQVYRPAVYERLCRESGVDPTDRTGYFPAYRKTERNGGDVRGGKEAPASRILDIVAGLER